MQASVSVAAQGTTTTTTSSVSAAAASTATSDPSPPPANHNVMVAALSLSGSQTQQEEEATTTTTTTAPEQTSQSDPDPNKNDGDDSTSTDALPPVVGPVATATFLPQQDEAPPRPSTSERRGSTTSDRRPSSGSLPRLVSTPTLTAPGEGASAVLAASLRKGNPNAPMLPKIDLQFGLWRDLWPKDIHGLICVDANLLVRYFRSLKKLDLVRFVIEERSTTHHAQPPPAVESAQNPAATGGKPPKPKQDHNKSSGNPTSTPPPLPPRHTTSTPLSADGPDSKLEKQPVTSLHYRVDLLDSFWTSSLINIGSLHHFVLEKGSIAVSNNNNSNPNSTRGGAISCVLCVADDMRRFVVFKIANDKLEQINASSLPLSATHLVPFAYRSLHYFLIYHQLSGEYGVLSTSTLVNRGVPTLVSRGQFRAGWSDVVWKGTHHVRCTRQKFFCYNYNTGESVFECVYIRGASGSASVCSAEHRTLPTGKPGSPRRQSGTSPNHAAAAADVHEYTDPEQTKSREELITVLNRKSCLVIPMSVGGNFACLLYHHSSFEGNKASLQRRHSSGRMLGSASTRASSEADADGKGNQVAEAASFVLRKRVFSHSEPWTHFCFLSDPSQEPDAAVSMLCYSTESGDVWVNRIFQPAENAAESARDVTVDVHMIPRGASAAGAPLVGVAGGGRGGLQRGAINSRSQFGSNELDVANFALEQAHRKSPFESPVSGTPSGGTPQHLSLEDPSSSVSGGRRGTRTRLSRTASGRRLPGSPSTSELRSGGDDGRLPAASPRRPRETSMERRARRREEAKSSRRPGSNQSTAQRLRGMPVATGDYKKDIEQVIRHLSITDFHEDSPYQAAALANLQNLAEPDPKMDRLLRSISRNSPLRSTSFHDEEDPETRTTTGGNHPNSSVTNSNHRFGVSLADSTGGGRPNSQRSARGDLPALAARGTTPLNYSSTGGQPSGAKTGRQPRPPPPDGSSSSERRYDSSPARFVRPEDPAVTNLLLSLASLHRSADRREPWYPTTPIGQTVPAPPDSPSATFERRYEEKLHLRASSRQALREEDLARLLMGNKREAYQETELKKSDQERLKLQVGSPEKVPHAAVEKTIQRLGVQDVELRRKQQTERDAANKATTVAEHEASSPSGKAFVLETAEQERAIVERLCDQSVALKAQHLEALKQKLYAQYPVGGSSPPRQLTKAQMKSMALRLDDESIQHKEKTMERIMKQLDQEQDARRLQTHPTSTAGTPLPRGELERIGTRLYRNEPRTQAANA